MGVFGRALPSACHRSTVQPPLLAGRLTKSYCKRINELGCTQKHGRPGHYSSTRSAGQLMSPGPISGVSLACRLLQGAWNNIPRLEPCSHMFSDPAFDCQTTGALPCMPAAPTPCQGAQQAIHAIPQVSMHAVPQKPSQSQLCITAGCCVDTAAVLVGCLPLPAVLQRICGQCIAGCRLLQRRWR